MFLEADKLKDAESFTAEIGTLENFIYVVNLFTTDVILGTVHDRHYANGIFIIIMRIYCALTGYQVLYQTLYKC